MVDPLLSDAPSWIEEDRPSSPFLDTVGKVSFSAFSAIGATVFTSGVLGRKRVVRAAAPLPSASALPPPPEELAESVPPFSSMIMPQVHKSAYDSLRWTENDKRHLKEMFTLIGRYSKGEISFFEFLRHAPLFRRYEAEMDAPDSNGEALHPFKFLATIFGDASLRAYMPSIFKDLLLRYSFMSGVIKGMLREGEKNNLTRFIEPFAQEVGVFAEQIKPLIQAQQWERLVQLLIQKSARG